MVELAHEAGMPPGVLNLVHGAKDTVDQLLTDPRVRAVSFVGSSTVAKYIYETSANNGKRVQALGGAKKPLRGVVRRRYEIKPCLPLWALVLDAPVNAAWPQAW